MGFWVLNGPRSCRIRRVGRRFQGAFVYLPRLLGITPQFVSLRCDVVYLGARCSIVSCGLLCTWAYFSCPGLLLGALAALS